MQVSPGSVEGRPGAVRRKESMAGRISPVTGKRARTGNLSCPNSGGTAEAFRPESLYGDRGVFDFFDGREEAVYERVIVSLCQPHHV